MYFSRPLHSPVVSRRSINNVRDRAALFSAAGEPRPHRLGTLLYAVSVLHSLHKSMVLPSPVPIGYVARHVGESLQRN
jgi:hypothetical protein